MWEAVHRRFAAADAARSAWLNSVVRFNPKCVASGKQPKIHGRKCACGRKSRGSASGKCRRCEFGGEVRSCADGCGATWLASENWMRKVCDVCGKARASKRERSRRQARRENVARAA